MRRFIGLGQVVRVLGVLAGGLCPQLPLAAQSDGCAHYNGDINGSGNEYIGESAGAAARGIDLTDAVRILNWLFQGGSAPAPLCAQQNLEACQAQQATCVSDLAASQAEREACAATLAACQAERDQALLDLAACRLERDTALADLAACQADRDASQAELDIRQAELALSVQPPSTGQVACFDDAGAVIDCGSSAYPGQDGFYQAGCPPEGRFADHGDGTVTDSCTGLMWARDTSPGTYSWQSALAYCNSLELAGYTDWRLPNLRELRTLMEYSGKEPPIDAVFQTIADMYWTSSTFTADTTHAFTVGFLADEGNTHDAKVDPFPLRAVRGGL